VLNLVSNQLTIESEHEKDGRRVAEILELPGILVYGTTQDIAIANVQALAFRVIADKLEHSKLN
jgi:predicted RNase H-like HicB family nuclease